MSIWESRSLLIYCGVVALLLGAVFALLTLLCLLRFDLSWLCLRNWILLCCLFCLSLTDLECMIIPDVCLIIAAAVWGIFLPLTGSNSTI